MDRRTFFPVVTAGLVGVVAPDLVYGSARSPMVGRRVPSFRLTDINPRSATYRRMINPRDKRYRGDVLVLNFGATWCRPCRDELPYLQEVHEKAPGINVMLAFDDSDSEVVSGFLTEEKYKGITMPSVVYGDIRDTRKIRFMARVGLAKIGYNTPLPQTYIVDSRGIIREHTISKINSADELVGLVQKYAK